MPDILLRASDGHELHALRLDPLGRPRGGLVVIQEIFGVNQHIRATAARYAAAGYAVIAPAFFDRIEPGIELGYGKAETERGRQLVAKLESAQILADLAAALEAVSGPAGEVAVVGYCWGGAVAWIAAARLAGISRAISYYGSRIVHYADEAPAVPVQLHVGRTDASFPLTTVHELGARYPELDIHEYDAGHGFDCDHRSGYDPQASAHALQRSLEFLAAASESPV
jgi:carboxymethylenebutenolidase